MDSSDTALDKSEIEVIQVNNGARRAPATSSVCQMNEKSWIKVIRISQRSWIWKA